MPWFPGDFRCRGDAWGRNVNGYCYVNDDPAHRYCHYCLVTFIFPPDFNWKTQWVDVTPVSESTVLISYKQPPWPVQGWQAGSHASGSGSQGSASGSQQGR